MIQLRDTYAQCGHILSISPWDTRADRTHMTCFIEFVDEDAVRRARARQVSSTKLHVVSQSPQLVAHFLSVVQPVQPLPLYSLTPSSSRLALHVVEVKQEPREDRRLLKRMSEGEVASSNESTPKKKARRSEKNADPGPSVPGDAYSVLSLDSRTPKALAKSPLSLQSPLNRQASDKENYAATTSPGSSPRRMLPLPRRINSVVQSPRKTAGPTRDANTEAQGVKTPAASTRQLDNGAHQEVQVQGIPHLDGLRVPSDVPALSPIITLTYNGQPVTCDLRKLEDDPAKIIAVLKAIASCALECDKWMIVAIQYRIKGLFKSAIAVLEAMIEGMSHGLGICVYASGLAQEMLLVMTSPPVSLPKSDIKPVFLMLSSCHRDLAAQGGAIDSASHVRRATECLQQVYGADVPRAQVTSEFAEARARSCMDLPHLLARTSQVDLGTGPTRECLIDTGNLPAVRVAHEQSQGKVPLEAPTSPTSLEGVPCERGDITPTRGEDRERSPSRSRTQTNSHSRTASYSERDKHVQMLEREIQSLRNRAAEQTATLLSVRKEKRKLEDELVTKHTACRRLQRDTESTSGELARAREELARAQEDIARLRDELRRVRRGEENALEQAAAEVANRRAAEGRAEVLREELERLRNEMNRVRAEGRDEREAERRARETFARLGALFTKAGRGKGGREEQERVDLGAGMGRDVGVGH
ncbi:hypothetical protein FOMPIDRAFT_1040862 [Fomitopsis schrenkii]|uniref:RRM domain-containing protein n=1 Tax=Fomitopsis schrenkii TaxID=2126942 RepID=S8FMU4_FOMSC|nr:hypothetical protein FOMPIDRAFT_1040862 [Fomitopsis schrenkii]